MTHARHAAPGHAAKVAGRIALGVVGAPVALFAAAGPASAADLATPTTDGSFADAASEATPSAVALPDLPDVGSTLPDLIGFELPSAPSLDSLPSTDSLPSIDSLPGADSLPALPGPDSLPSVGQHHLAPLVSIDVNLPSADDLPSTDDLPSADSLPSLPGTDSLPSLDSLPGADSLPSTDAVTSTAGLITGLI